MLGYRIPKSPIRFGLLMSAFLLSSCGYPALKKPLSDPDNTKPDARLFGVWRPEEKDPTKPQPGFVFIGKSGHRGVPLGIMKFLVVGIDENNEIIREEPGYFFTTAVDNKRYLHFFDKSVLDPNKFPVWDQENIKEYTLYRYKIEADKLTIWLMDSAAVETAIRKGNIDGTIREEKNAKSITLAGGDNLSSFLAKGGDKVLFSKQEWLVFKRVK